MSILGNLARTIGIKSGRTRTSVQRKSSLRIKPQLSALEDRVALTGGLPGANIIVDAPPPVFAAAFHSEFLTRVNGVFSTVSADIGTVTAATSNTITMSRADGSHVTLGYTPSSIFTAQGSNMVVTAQSLVGKQEELVSVKATAYLGFAPNGNFLGTQGHNVLTYYNAGVSYTETLDYGTVTAVSGTSMTILRGDGTYVTTALRGSTKLGSSVMPYRLGQVSRGNHILLEQVTPGTASKITNFRAGQGSFSASHPELFPKLQ